MHVSEDVWREKREGGGGGDVQEKQEPHTKDVGNKSVKQNEWDLLEKNHAIAEFSNDFNPTNLSNPSSLQINSQLVARGAGGRGKALG